MSEHDFIFMLYLFQAAYELPLYGTFRKPVVGLNSVVMSMDIESFYSLQWISKNVKMYKKKCYRRKGNECGI